ncbi:MAG: hypothetical protein WB791_03990 [Waddliaceae bacterium]
MKAWKQWLVFPLTLLFPATLIGVPSTMKSACFPNKHHGLVCATYWTYRSDDFWNAQGKRCEAFNDFKKYAYRLYSEYGITSKDALTARGGWAKVDESMNGREFGFEDIEISWKHRLRKTDSYVMTTELVGIIPAKKGYRPGLRYGQWGGEVNLLATSGFSLWDRQGSYDLRLGYRIYEGFPSDQLRADANIHFLPLPRLKVSASGQLEYGVWNGKSRIDQSLFLLNPNYRLLKGKIEVEYCINRFCSIYAGYYRHLWGRNIGTRGGGYAGAEIQF